MQRLPISIITLGLALAVSLMACSDDEPTDAGGSGLGQSDEGTANALAFELVLPLMQALNIGPYLDQIPSGGLTPDQCEPLEICSSGSAMLCLGLGTISLEFSDCGASGGNIDGLVSIEGGATQGAGTLSLTVGDFTLAGTTSYTYSSGENCFSQFFTNVAVTAGDLEMTLSGIVGYCPPDVDGQGNVFPDFAQIEVRVPSLDRTADVIILGDPVPGSVEIVILDLARTNVLLVCNGTLIPPALSCYTGTE